MVCVCEDELTFKSPVKFSYHFSKLEGTTKLIIYSDRYNPTVWKVKGVIVHGASDSRTIVPANFTLTRGHGRKFKCRNSLAMIFP